MNHDQGGTLGLRLCAGAALLLALAAAQPADALTIKTTFDSSITSLANAAAVESAFNTVANEFDGAFANAATVNITVSWGSVAGGALPSGDIGASLDNLSGAYSYSSVKTYLGAASKANPTDAVLASAVSHLPTSDPSHMNQYEIPYAEAKALGLLPSNGRMMDGYIGFKSGMNYDFNPVDGITVGAYDFQGLAAHEIEEVLGRITGLQSSGAQWATPFDLYRYTSAGVSSFSYSGHAYFSIDGGLTDLGNYNYSGGGDRSDWLTLASSNDIQDAYFSTGKALSLTASDLAGLDAMGWGVSRLSGLKILAAIGSFSPVGAGLPAVPEPATWAMMLIGFGMIGAAARRRGRLAAA